MLPANKISEINLSHSWVNLVEGPGEGALDLAEVPLFEQEKTHLHSGLFIFKLHTPTPFGSATHLPTVVEL